MRGEDYGDNPIQKDSVDALMSNRGGNETESLVFFNRCVCLLFTTHICKIQQTIVVIFCFSLIKTQARF